MRRLGTLLVCVAIGVSGCTRAFYRRWADRDTYKAIAEHADEGRWPINDIAIVPPPQSRLYDPFNPDRPPMPPDDPAADRFMMWPNGVRNSRHFHDDGDAPFIEAPDWKQYLQLNADGKLQLTPDRAVELGVLNSREYETALEDLYLQALALTLNRFEFDCHWFLTNNTVWTQFGSSDTEVNTLSSQSTFGFTKNLYAGGQFMAEFVNNLLVTFSGIDQTVWSSNLMATFTQPLLRGAGRRVRMEPLTEQERVVLYAVRDFARFRKRFYVNLTTVQGGGYLALLLQVQNIRNLENDVKSQEQNYRLHQAQFTAQTVSTIQVDQAYQSYLQSRLSLIQARTALETSLDSYKFALGLPPGLPVTLDDALLKPFQLAAPELETLQNEVQSFFDKFRERDQPPGLEELQEGYAKLKAFHQQGEALLKQTAEELKKWKSQLGQGEEDANQVRREREIYENVERQLPETATDVEDLKSGLAKDRAALPDLPPVKRWDALLARCRQLIAQLGQVFVLQNQIRVYLIRLKSVPYKLDDALLYARDNRLDLMNLRGRVVDAWRQIAVTANALKAGLNVTATANVATKPGADAPFDFRASASQYTVGAQFDGPLNRYAERNAYRASQINYQNARRNFMALDDQISSSIRGDIRTLEEERLSFSIARLSLITAARQVEAARDRLLLVERGADTTSTLDILRALNDLLAAKSQLIRSWTNYESTRIQLLFDMDALQVTPRGVPADEPDNDPDSLPSPTPVLPGQPGADR